jgi:hypothetical protein
MFGKAIKTAAQAVKKAAPKMAQKAPPPASQTAKKPMGALQTFANRSKAPAQSMPKMPIVTAANLQKGAAARSAYEAQQGATKKGGFGVGLGGGAGVKSKAIPTQSGAMAKFGGMATGALKAATGATPGAKPLGAMKKGGAVPSKMGAVKTSAKTDGVATKGKTKGAMIKMAKGGKSC